MSYVADELRRLRKENVRLNRKIALASLDGTVAERDEKARKVRLEIGRDPETDEKILSPWARVQSNSAGAFKAFVLPSVGEQMYLDSGSGVVGADSVARFGTFNDTNKHPEQQADENVLFEVGSARLSATKDKITFKLGAEGFEVTSSGLQMLGKFIAKGGSRPAHYKGGKDSDGDTAVDGNDNVLI